MSLNSQIDKLHNDKRIEIFAEAYNELQKDKEKHKNEVEIKENYQENYNKKYFEINIRANYKKLEPMNFKKTNIKEAVVDNMNKKSKLRYALQADKLENDKKYLRDCVVQSKEFDDRYKGILNKGIDNLKSESDNEENLKKNEIFEKRIQKVREEKLIIPDDFDNFDNFLYEYYIFRGYDGHSHYGLSENSFSDDFD